MTTKRALAPVVDDTSRILILGTLSGDDSLRHQRYYDNRTNDFWTLLSDIFGTAAGHSYPQRLTFLASHRVALWDVLESAERVGSTDRAIANAQPNSFGDLFATYPTLRRVAFNGTKAATFWRRYVPGQPVVPHDELVTGTLPSSSNTPGLYVLPYDQKLIQWAHFLSDT
ncbi:MAG: DNA-deoxyinosine glycosylase [Acidimicrobiales bacterium]